MNKVLCKQCPFCNKVLCAPHILRKHLKSAIHRDDHGKLPDSDKFICGRCCFVDDTGDHHSCDENGKIIQRRPIGSTKITKTTFVDKLQQLLIEQTIASFPDIDRTEAAKKQLILIAVQSVMARLENQSAIQPPLIT